MGLNVRSNLFRLIRDGGKVEGMGTYVLPSTRYTVTTRLTLRLGGQLCDSFSAVERAADADLGSLLLQENPEL